jgi:hypothetical protein
MHVPTAPDALGSAYDRSGERDNRAIGILRWMNWCGVDVGLLEIRVTFDAGNAAVIAPLGGSLLARCDNPEHPSSIRIDSVTASSP